MDILSLVMESVSQYAPGMGAPSASTDDPQGQMMATLQSWQASPVPQKAQSPKWMTPLKMLLLSPVGVIAMRIALQFGPTCNGKEIVGWGMRSAADLPGIWGVSLFFGVLGAIVVTLFTEKPTVGRAALMVGSMSLLPLVMLLGSLVA